MDDALYNLWRDGLVTVEDALNKSHRPDDLAKRIVNARRGLTDDAESENEDH
jgi:twitching motility protein PilT